MPCRWTPLWHAGLPIIKPSLSEDTSLMTSFHILSDMFDLACKYSARFSWVRPQPHLVDRTRRPDPNELTLCSTLLSTSRAEAPSSMGSTCTRPSVSTSASPRTGPSPPPACARSTSARRASRASSSRCRRTSAMRPSGESCGGSAPSGEGRPMTAVRLPPLRPSTLPDTQQLTSALLPAGSDGLRTQLHSLAQPPQPRTAEIVLEAVFQRWLAAGQDMDIMPFESPEVDEWRCVVGRSAHTRLQVDLTGTTRPSAGTRPASSARTSPRCWRARPSASQAAPRRT